MFQFFSRLWYRSREIGSTEYARLVRLRQTNMSEVWLAERKHDKAITVIKIARIDETQYARANQRAIRNEAAYLMSFQNERRVVQMYHAAETDLDGHPRFLAVEYLKGGTLDELLQQPTLWGHLNLLLVRLARLLRFKLTLPSPVPNYLKLLGIQYHQLVHAPLPVEQALQLFSDLAAALAKVHQVGVVHRDIKPDNIMFRKRPRYGYLSAADNVVLIDFGVAARRDRLSGVAIARGWSEPRLIKARDAGEKLIVKPGFDVYCLGKVLRYLVTGEKPINKSEKELRAELAPSTLRFHTRLTSTKRTQVAASLTGLIRRCLADDPDQRPPADQLVLAADQILDNLTRLPIAGRRAGIMATVLTCFVAGLLIINLSGATNYLQDRLAALKLLGTVSPTEVAAGNITPSAIVSPAIVSSSSLSLTLTAIPTATIAAVISSTNASILPATVSQVTPTREPTATATLVAPATAISTPTLARPTPTRDPTATPTNTPAVALVFTPPPPMSSVCFEQGTVIVAPSNGESVRGTIDIIGTATHAEFTYYKIEIARGSRKDNYLDWAFFSRHESPVTNGMLGQLDTTTLQNGTWTLRVIVPFANGGYPNPDPCEVMIVIDN